jgi:predicted dehydrogenase
VKRNENLTAAIRDKQLKSPRSNRVAGGIDIYLHGDWNYDGSDEDVVTAMLSKNWKAGPAMKIGIIGYGYWGPNLVRNFSEAEGVEVWMVADLKDENLAKVRKRYPSIRTTTQVEEVLKSPDIDAIALATPVHTHYDLGLRALRHGKHLFVEKPLASSSEQALELITESEKRGLTLCVDHTFVYTGAVMKIKEMVEKGQLGKLLYYDSVRVNLGLFQHDVNVLWDLAVHDLAIMDYVLGRKPVAVAATGISHVPNKPENIAYLTCFFEDNLLAHIHANWLAPVKMRKTLIGGDKQMILYDDVEVTEKIKVYDKGIVVSDRTEDIYKLMVSYRTGDMYAPQLDTTEALLREANLFVDCVLHKKKPISDGKMGLRIVRILEAATQSMREKGRLVELQWKKYGL